MPFAAAHTAGSSTVSHRWVVALAIITAFPVAASAQFTTFIVPPNRVNDSVKAVVAAEQRAVSDSITHVQITDMKTWVDSASGIVPARSLDSTVDSARVATTTSNGVIAPETASPLPFLLALGGCSMLLGWLLLRRPRVDESRIDR
jgi:hypothetical protein